MDPLQIERVRGSYALFAPQAAAMGRTFYRFLFEQNPELRPLFGGDIEVQARKLMDMLASVVEHLDQPDQLRDRSRALGERHAAYGVQESHYDDVGTALLRTLHAGLGAHYNDEVEEAWASVYGELAEAMMAAGRSIES
jgi:hemoglobin-like flavoprotein